MFFNISIIALALFTEVNIKKLLFHFYFLLNVKRESIQRRSKSIEIYTKHFDKLSLDKK